MPIVHVQVSRPYVHDSPTVMQIVPLPGASRGHPLASGVGVPASMRTRTQFHPSRVPPSRVMPATSHVQAKPV
jgi:hypothetical protein